MPGPKFAPQPRTSDLTQTIATKAAPTLPVAFPRRKPQDNREMLRSLQKPNSSDVPQSGKRTETTSMNPPLTRALSRALLLLVSTCSPVLLRAQTDAPPAPAQPASSASSILNPAISTLQASLDGVRVEKWKASGVVRDDTENNIESIRRDLDQTLAPLLVTADAAPSSVTQVLPAYRNVEALYDVLLRISAAARLAAPPQQSASLDQALTSLDSARRSLGDQIQSSAARQDRAVHDLQAAARAVPPPVPQPAPCPPAAPAAKKRKPRPKPSPTPGAATAQPADSSPPGK